MTDEIVFHHGTTMVRRLRLSPGEAMPWHRDPFHRVAVVLGGDLLSIEYRDGGDPITVQITAGQVEWEEPSARVHRAVNVGKQRALGHLPLHPAMTISRSGRWQILYRPTAPPRKTAF
jgi:quercetin dioxygenase-like cupin family protein